MIAGRTAKLLSVATFALLMLLCDAASRCAGAATPKQRSLDEWRSLTAPNRQAAPGLRQGRPDPVLFPDGYRG